MVCIQLHLSAVLPNAWSKRKARSAVIGASQAHTAVSADSSVCNSVAVSTVVKRRIRTV